MGRGMCTETVPCDVAELKRDSVRGPLLCELNLCSKRSPGCTGCPSLYLSCDSFTCMYNFK